MTPQEFTEQTHNYIFDQIMGLGTPTMDNFVKTYKPVMATEKMNQKHTEDCARISKDFLKNLKKQYEK